MVLLEKANGILMETNGISVMVSIGLLELHEGHVLWRCQRDRSPKNHNMLLFRCFDECW